LGKQGLDFRWTKKRTGKKEQKTRGETRESKHRDEERIPEDKKTN
jgi:hypothetical protein